MRWGGWSTGNACHLYMPPPPLVLPIPVAPLRDEVHWSLARVVFVAVAACQSRLPSHQGTPSMAGRQVEGVGLGALWRRQNPSKQIASLLYVFYASRAIQRFNLSSILTQTDQETAMRLQTAVPAARSLLLSSSPFPPFPPLLPPPPLPFPSAHVGLHACPKGCMDHQRAPVHEAWPELQVGACQQKHPIPLCAAPLLHTFFAG